MTKLKVIISIFLLTFPFLTYFTFSLSLQKQLHFASRKQKGIVSSLCSHEEICFNVLALALMDSYRITKSCSYNLIS